MSNDLQDIIKQADLLIKAGKYKGAWKLLVPHQKEPAARKRLAWLQQKQLKESKPNPSQQTASNSGKRRLSVLVASVVMMVGLGVFLIYRISQQAPEATTVTGTPVAVGATTVTGTPVAVGATTVTGMPAAVGAPISAGEATQIVFAPTGMPSATPTATALPPTENSHEVSLQQQLRDWLSTVQGVSKVLSFDVDLPDNEPPLAYVEVNVDSGFNDTHIPDKIVQKLNGVLNTTHYSDLTIIMNDVSSVVQYSFDSANKSWNPVVLASTPSSED